MLQVRLFDGNIRIKKNNGYLCLTDLFEIGKKKLRHYKDSKSTKEFLILLSQELNISIENLWLSSVSGEDKGTFVHPRIAIDAAYYLKGEFKIKEKDV